MRMQKTCLAGTAVLCMALSITAPALAQPEEVWEAEMQAGLAALNGARLDDAKRRFGSAVRIADGMLDRDRAATSLINLADIHRIQSEYAEAEALTRRALAMIEQLFRELKVDARADEVHDRLKQLYPQSPYLAGGSRPAAR